MADRIVYYAPEPVNKKKRQRIHKLRFCSIEGCDNPHEARGYCGKHYQRFKTHGDPLGGRERGTNGMGYETKIGYVYVQKDKVLKRAHVLVAERALGHPLPPGAIVHHHDEDKANNAPTNLVICPSDAYHKLLHKRMRALDACGNADWRKCTFCKVHRPTSEMTFTKGNNSWHHKSCAAADMRNRNAIKNERHR